MLVVDHERERATRFRLLETLRDYATVRLEHTGELPALRRRHLDHYLDRAEQIDRTRMEAGSDADVMSLAPDADNLRAALRWALEHDPTAGLRLAAALEAFWMVRAVGEGRRWLDAALAAAPEPTRYRARALIVPPLVVASGLPWAEARAYVEESGAIYRSLGEERGAALAAATLGMAAFFNGELEAARDCLEEALTEYAELAHPLFHARARIFLGGALSFTPRRAEEGRRLLREALERSRAIRDGWGAGVALMLLGLAALRGGLRGEARDDLGAALRLNLQAGVTASAIGGMGQVALDDDPRRALTLLEAATAVRERCGVAGFPVEIGRQLERASAAAERRLARPVAERCRERGRAFTTEEALAYALDETAASASVEADLLTARQQEIAVLVAQGLSNREMAERLHLSVRTVDTHVENIFSRLGFHSRARLAAWAEGAGLTRADP
jgi:non-specific serine/threonine protein kinase